MLLLIHDDLSSSLGAVETILLSCARLGLDLFHQVDECNARRRTNKAIHFDASIGLELFNRILSGRSIFSVYVRVRQVAHAGKVPLNLRSVDYSADTGCLGIIQDCPIGALGTTLLVWSADHALPPLAGHARTILRMGSKVAHSDSTDAGQFSGVENLPSGTVWVQPILFGVAISPSHHWQGVQALFSTCEMKLHAPTAGTQAVLAALRTCPAGQWVRRYPPHER